MSWHMKGFLTGGMKRLLWLGVCLIIIRIMFNSDVHYVTNVLVM